jgi:signal transduction histidine kinase
MMSISDEYAASLSETMSIVHDLRNPLSTIHGSAELLVDAGLSDAQVRRLAQNLYKASIRMNELLEECLVRYRRVERAKSCDLGDLVKDAVDEVCLRAQRQSVEISDSLPEELRIVVDRPRIRRVLVNLLVNSLDVMPNGGEITISATAQSQTVLIKVSDTGPGIAPEIRDRLFQPFATAGKVNGLGLGLSSSRRALIEHGGEIWNENTSLGACFVLCLPRAPRNEHQ